MCWFFNFSFAFCLAFLPCSVVALLVGLLLLLAKLRHEKRIGSLRRLLKQVGLADAASKRPSQLSGGMQQRVAIARALSLSPRLILADEPTGNLDTQSANEIFELLQTVNREHQSACLIVTHDPGLAARCQRRIEIVDGQLVGAKAAVPP